MTQYIHLTRKYADYADLKNNPRVRISMLPEAIRLGTVSIMEAFCLHIILTLHRKEKRELAIQ